MSPKATEVLGYGFTTECELILSGGAVADPMALPVREVKTVLSEQHHLLLGDSAGSLAICFVNMSE